MRTPENRFRAAVLVAVLFGSLVTVAQAPGSAQECIPTPITKCRDKPSDPAPTPEPEPSPSPSPDPAPPPSGGSGDSGGPSGGGGSGSSAGERGEDVAPSDGAAALQEAGVFPGARIPFAFSGPNSTEHLMATLAELAPTGISLEEAFRQVAGPFPVAGPAWWTDDWHAPRSGGRVHKGLDIFAPHGTPLVAAADGVISQKGAGGLCGIFVEVTDADGVQYFYCHLSGWAPDIAAGQRVRAGDLVGFVGNTGNAINTPSHVHFEVQPGGVPVPPKPVVDAWLTLAERRALDLVRATPVPRTLPVADGFRLTRLFDLSGGGGGPTRFVASRVGSGPRLAPPLDLGVSVESMALTIDWPEAPHPVEVGDLPTSLELLMEAAPGPDALWGPLLQGHAHPDVGLPLDGSD